jgi:DNA-binding CsgD family transcriptional regulator/tetratricopeptide (TPR) repeat protein
MELVPKIGANVRGASGWRRREAWNDVVTEPTSAAGAELLERAHELAELRGVVHASRVGHGSTRIVEGPAGIGKSALLRAAVAHAHDAGVRTLTASPSEFEGAVAFGLVRDLLGPCLSDVADNPRRHRAKLLLEGDPTAIASAPDAPRAALVTLHELIVDLARDGPLLLCVDDAHWADAASLRFLAFLARRIGSLRVAIVIAVRSPGGGTPPAALGELLATERGRTLRPAPLDEQATATFMRAAWQGQLSSELIRACYTATNGNPYLLHEVIAALRQSGVRPSTAAISQLLAVGARAVTPMVLERLDRLPPEAIALARAAAVAGELGSPQEVARLAGMDPARATDAAQRLVTAEVLASADELQFVHPLVRSAIRASLTEARIAELAQGAARRLVANGRVETAAACLLGLPPAGDAWTAGTLADAGRMARARGAPDVAVTLLRRALAEPPPPERRTGVLTELGIAQIDVDDADSILSLTAARDATTDARARAAIATELARALIHRLQIREAVELLDAAIAELGDEAPAKTEELEAMLLHHASWDPKLRSLFLARLGPLEDAPLNPGASELAYRTRLVALAHESIASCRPAGEGIRFAERALAGGVLLVEATGTHCAAALQLALAGRPELARTHLEDAIAEAQERGAIVIHQTALALRAVTALLEGHVTAAALDAQTALALGREEGISVPHLVWVLVDALLEQGRVAEAEASLREHHLTGPMPDLGPFNAILHRRGRTWIAAGSVPAGLDDVLLAGRRQQALGQENAAFLAWRPTAARALLALGEFDPARALGAENLELARAFGAPHTLGAALRVHAQTLGGAEQLAMLHEAVEILEDSFARLELAAARTDLGLALLARDDRGPAREMLTSAVGLADELGAVVVRERAIGGLVASGARPRRSATRGPGSLTPAERRVAKLAAAGATNPEIAAELFVSVKTVETHLSRSFRKLGIQSRAQLGPLLGGSRDAVAP